MILILGEIDGETTTDHGNLLEQEGITILKFGCCGLFVGALSCLLVEVDGQNTIAMMSVWGQHESKTSKLLIHQRTLLNLEFTYVVTAR
jgi:hypothetical protein